MNIIILVLLIFIAFTIGLNLGLHGLFLFPIQSSSTFENAHNQNVEVYSNNRSTIVESDTQSLLTQLPVTVSRKQIVSTTVTLPEPTVQPVRHDTSIIEGKLTQVKNRVRVKMSNNLQGTIVHAAFWKVDVPIVLLTCNRPELLEGTIKSLLAVRGVKKENILISQDGTMQSVKSIAYDFGLSLVQNTEV